ncbi:MAG TPA: NYN domain-containing protein [Candidatus Dormibacteraeota bacterium]|nr:NYN domain-containing protein [Candidatus Dormibacteraeota bacterium]
MGKNVAVFVDVANIFYAAKAAGVDIDYVTLLKAGSAGRDLVRAYAYTGLDPDNENQRNFHEFLRRHGYKVVSKDIRKYGDGKVKANLDIELVVDMMKTARNLDVAIVVSGDGDFAPAIRAVQEMGVRVEVVSFRGNTSSDLMDVADLFTDITQIAKVEKGSSRSGRRVADDEQDLSMTEVPDKQSEGTGERGRGRGRTRRTPVAAAAAAAAPRSRSRVAPVENGDAPLVVLPGEKLSRASVAAASVDPEDADFGEAAEGLEAVDGEPSQVGDEANTEEGRRRRRRRGGRGRGRARGREDAPFAEAPEGGVREPVRSATPLDDDAADADELPAPSRRAASAFGSVWDSQIGIPAGGRGAPVVEDEDFDEPAVPEYLIAERRQRDNARGGMRGGGGGGRGRGGAYAAALDRERFGGGRGSTPSRFQQPAPGVREPNFNRSDRPERIDRGDRQPFRQAPRPAPRPSGDEPWSEVPPEIEPMLRAQLGSRPAARPEPAPVRSEAASAPAEPAATPAPRRGRRPAEAVEASSPAAAAPAGAASDDAAPKARRTSSRRPKAATPSGAAEVVVEAEAPAKKPVRSTAKAAPRATASRTKAKAASAPDDAAASAATAADGNAAPKRRVTRRKAASES